MSPPLEVFSTSKFRAMLKEEKQKSFIFYSKEPSPDLDTADSTASFDNFSRKKD